MKTFIASIALVVLVATAHSSHAQHINVAAIDDDTNIVAVKTGVEHGLMLGLGYARAHTIANRPVVLGADVALGWAPVDVNDFRVSAGALATLVGESRWRIVGALVASIRGADNDLGRLTSVGGDVAIMAGRYAPRGFIGAELGVDAALATHVTHGDGYRMNVFADAQDGWYAAPGMIVRAGLQAGIAVRRHDVILRAGRLVDTAGQSPLIPFYGTLTFDTRW